MKDFDAKSFLVRTVTVAYIALVFLLLFIEIPAENKEVLIAQVAVLAAGIGAFFGYFFGSSLGSSKKTDALLNSDKKDGQ